MYNQINRKETRASRVRRIRAKVRGTNNRPRLAVFRSLTRISAQLIDDTVGKTLAEASDKGLSGSRTERAKQVGALIAQAAKAKKITTVVFDRAGYQYHGRVAALATGAREAGLQF